MHSDDYKATIEGTLHQRRLMKLRGRPYSKNYSKYPTKCQNRPQSYSAVKESTLTQYGSSNLTLKITLLLLAVFLLTACGGSGASGNLRLDPLPQNIAEPCPTPEAVLDSTLDYHAVNQPGFEEVLVGNMGLELNECRDEKAVAVSAYETTRITFEDPLWRANPRRIRLTFPE